jgi:thiol:disulfide interchange protein
VGLKAFLKCLLPLSLFLFSPLFADSAAPKANQESPVHARLLTDHQTIQPGKPFWVGVELSMDKGWDTYWINPGEAGFPTQVDWELPAGFKAGPLLWPYPEQLLNEGLVAFGYLDHVILLTEITPPQKLLSTPVSLKAKVSWLACKEMCVPGGSDLLLSLPITQGPPKIDPAASLLLNKAYAAIPKELDSKEGTLSIVTQKESITLHFNPKAGAFKEIESLFFIPETGAIFDYAAPQAMETTKQGLALNIKRAAQADMPELLKGVLLVSEKGKSGKRAIQIAMKSAAQPGGAVNSLGFEMALLFAFLGGMILNVMPCVLPVVALKLFGFMKMAHEKRHIIFQHGAIYSGGVLLSFWILSGALLLLRFYGEGIGWGFQLQEPIFVAILAALLFLLGLSLFGVFEMGTSLLSLGSKVGSSSQRSPLASSFMSGVLATLVATPCTGPLLGPALGFAMTLPALKSLLIFTAMGIGMAFPYLLFSAFPRLIRFLPKPGNWMLIFKQIMGFLMMATVIWLVWVFSAETDHLATLLLLLSLLVMAVAAWIFGQWGIPTKRRATRLIAYFFTALLLTMGTGATVFAAKNHKASEIVEQQGGWEAFSPERVSELRSQGKAVFVDFTAKWCLICQANKVVLHSSEVEKMFKENGVVTLVADWTKRDPIITKELEKLGRTGVPVYVLYPAEPKLEPYLLPQTLTAKVMNDYLERLKTVKVAHAH